MIFGGLHIEMALWSVCGDLLEDSGWTASLAEAGIALDPFVREIFYSMLKHLKPSFHGFTPWIILIMHDGFQAHQGHEILVTSSQRRRTEILGCS